MKGLQENAKKMQKVQKRANRAAGDVPSNRIPSLNFFQDTTAKLDFR
jgi:hypothetical protein